MEKFKNIHPEEVTFLEPLHESEYSVIFVVSVRGFKCVLKVNREQPGAIINLHETELGAYLRLEAADLCEKGHIPQFYADIGEIKPELWSPTLDMLLGDQLPPRGILIEYIPNMEPLSLENYTRERMARFIEIMKEIQAEMVVHDDPSPRNMMIVRGSEPERVLWLDFDRALLYDKESITAEQKAYIAEEEVLLHEMGEDIELDIPGGKIKESFLYFNGNS